MSKKRTPIRTLAEAERWCMRNKVQLGWCGDCPKRRRWYACGEKHDRVGPTPWEAVEALRRKVEE